MKIVCRGIFISRAFIFSYLLYLIWSLFPPHFCCRKEKNAVQLDDEGGRTFLRVLIHLIMHDYPPLLSGALHLLFKHFSQRAEVLQAFKQVWMRVIPGNWAQGAFPKAALLLELLFVAWQCYSPQRSSISRLLWLCAGVYYSSVPPEIVISGSASIRENVGPWWASLRDPSGTEPVPHVWETVSPCQQWHFPVFRATQAGYCYFVIHLMLLILIQVSLHGAPLPDRAVPK